jgi:uncharacterized protein DUF6188
MYGREKGVDLVFPSGREIEMVSIGAYRTNFCFDQDVVISVYSLFAYFDGDIEWAWTPEPGAEQVAGRTVALLGIKIESFQWFEDGTLKLSFSKGQRLTILDSSKEYESYDITRPGQTIIV